VGTDDIPPVTNWSQIVPEKANFATGKAVFATGVYAFFPLGDYMKATCLVLVGWLAMMSLGLMACQGLASLPTATSPAGPTLVYSPTSTLSPTVPIPMPVPVPSIPLIIPAQSCLLSNLPAKGEKLLQQANVLAWSPDSHSLAFLGPGEIDDSLLGTLTLVEGPGFETPHHLASNVVGDPAWSPDGSRIAFVAFRSDDELGTVMTVNADGSGLHDLFPGETARTDPGMGYKAVGGWLDEQRILIMTNCGTGCSRPLQLDLKDGVLTPIFRPGGEGAGYAWSPDRNYVVVTAGFNPQIGIASGTGGEITWLSGHHAHDPAWARFWTLFADWAPDGSHFLFLQQPDDASEPPTLWVWNVEAGSGSPLLPGVVAATWSPEGDTIAFLSLGQPHLGSDGTWQDVVAMLEGPNTLGVGLYLWPEKQIIAFTLAGEVSLGYRWPDQLGQLVKPAWAPNGNLLVYRDGAGIAWILSADDLARYELDAKGASVSTLSWSPDSKKLAVSTSENLMVFAVPGTGAGLPLPTQTTEPPSPAPSPTLTYTPSPQPTATSVPPSPTLTPSPLPTLTHTPSSSPSAALPTATAISDRAAISPGLNTTMGSSWHRILFTYNHAGATELWTIDPTNGTANQQIRPNDVIHDPAMSPSGDVIAYIRISDSIDPQSSTTSELWLMDKDGSNPNTRE